jgi:hypothetical protein
MGTTSPLGEDAARRLRRLIEAASLTPYAGYLAMRWQEDCTNAVQLAAEIRSRGYTGSERSVRDLVWTWRTSQIAPSPAPVRSPPSRRMTTLMMCPRHKLTPDEHTELRDVLDRCVALRAVNELVSDLAGWLVSAKAITSTPGPQPPNPVATHRSADLCARAGLHVPSTQPTTLRGRTNVHACRYERRRSPQLYCSVLATPIGVAALHGDFPQTP